MNQTKTPAMPSFGPLRTALRRITGQPKGEARRRGPPVPTLNGVFWRRLAYAGSRYGPLPWLKFSPPVLGVLGAMLLSEQRAKVRRNLRRVLGVRPAVAEHLDVAKTFATYASCFAEALGAERFDVGEVRPEIRGGEHLASILDANRGAVLATAHVGAWDLAPQWLLDGSGRQRDIVVVMASESDVMARRLHDRVRARSGVRVVHATQHPLDSVGLLSDLRCGSLVCVQIDRLPTGLRAVTVPVFDQPFRMPQGPFLLAAFACVPVVPLFVARRGFLEYEVDIGPPIELAARPSLPEIEKAAGSVAAHMERFIRSHPTQWFHFVGEEHEAGRISASQPQR